MKRRSFSGADYLGGLESVKPSIVGSSFLVTDVGLGTRRLLIYRRRMNAQFSTFRSDCLRAPQVTSEDENDPPSKPARRPW